MEPFYYIMDIEDFTKLWQDKLGEKTMAVEVLEVVSGAFNKHVEIGGQFDHLEVKGDFYIIYGHKTRSTQHLWLAATGARMPTNTTADSHLQTLVWQDRGGQRLVAHVFELTGRPIDAGYGRMVYRERVPLGNSFSVNLDCEFVYVHPVSPGLIDTWFYTDGDRQAGGVYMVIPFGKVVRTPHTVIYDDGDVQILELQSAPNSAPPRRQQVPEPVNNGLVFNYEKSDGTQRLARVNHIEYGVRNGRQFINGYDHERSGMRTFYLDQIVDFPDVQDA